MRLGGLKFPELPAYPRAPLSTAAAFNEDTHMRGSRFLSAATILAASALMLSGCGYNTLQSQDEQVTAAWSQVVNQYQRRADLIPNLVKTVQGAVASEKDILDAVVTARSKAGSIQATPELLNDPKAFQQ